MLFNDSRSLIFAKKQATRAASSVPLAAAAATAIVAAAPAPSAADAASAAIPALVGASSTEVAAGDKAGVAVAAVAANATDPEPDTSPELDIVINNVVCSFSVRCHLDLREIALKGSNVEYRRENGMLTMRLRRPYTTASVWSSGRITCTGATSESLAKVAARRFARCLGKLGFPVHFQKFGIFNVLGTCSMPWAIKIFHFSERHRDNANYEPELHPGVTYRMRDPKATLKIFSTGSITVVAATVSAVDSAIQRVYPLVYEFRNENSLKEVINQTDDNQTVSRSNTGGSNAAWRLKLQPRKFIPNPSKSTTFSHNGMTANSYAINPASGIIPNATRCAGFTTNGLSTTGLNSNGLRSAVLNSNGLGCTGPTIHRSSGISSTALNSTLLCSTGLSSTGRNSTGLSSIYNGLSSSIFKPTGYNAAVLNSTGLNSTILNSGNLKSNGLSSTALNTALVLRSNSLNGINSTVSNPTGLSSIAASSIGHSTTGNTPALINSTTFRSNVIGSTATGFTNISSTGISTTASSTSNNLGRSENSILSNARRRAADIWASKVKNKRVRYNDFEDIADVVALARVTNKNAASAYASGSVSTTVKSTPFSELKPQGLTQAVVPMPTTGSGAGGSQDLIAKFKPQDPIEGMENVDDVDWQI